ncbi:Flagellar motor protein [Aequoribacter fuscus]|uniref:Flagellar motor protein n=1 Tax=Aequoribacter fuscus TaxID=2518989 RepID=F3L5Q7_9GAMM|nr:VWA domain-containing protein [Aequoribacter fuscus]EGG28347.1 Flagellar motor protein [Aequoribacter fuscus]
MRIRVSTLNPKAKKSVFGGVGRKLGLALYLVSVLAAQSANAVDGQCASRADLWFANDESGSVDATEFEGALNFIYQVADSFEYDASTGAQAGIIGWADELQPTDVIVPITEDFRDVDDVGLVGSLTTDGDGKGVRELYTARVSGSNGTRLDLATQRLAYLINAGNGARAGVPSVAVILTDANQGQLEQALRGGGGAWIKAAENLRAAGPDGTEVSDLSDDDSNLEDSPTLFKFETSPDIRITISASAPVKVTGAQAVDLSRVAEAARFGEFDLGFAYRPVETNRFNALAMVSYIYDLDPINQNGGMYADEKGVVYSFEGLYALTDSLKVGGKIAHKRSSIRVDRDSGAFIDATTDLRILRERYHLVWKLDALAEYRWLEVDEIGDEKQGGLLGLEVQLSPNFSIGGGYNFTEFNDRLTALDYDAKGWFINISGHF